MRGPGRGPARDLSRGPVGTPTTRTPSAQSSPGYVAALQRRKSRVEARPGVLAGEVDLVRAAGIVGPHRVRAAGGIGGYGNRGGQAAVRGGDERTEDAKTAAAPGVGGVGGPAGACVPE